MLYWEYGNQVAVRHGSWKAIKAGKKPQWALYDLTKDPSETNDLSSSEAGQLAKMQALPKESTNPCDRVSSLIRPGPGTIVTGRPSSGSQAFRPWPFKVHFKTSITPDLLPTDQFRLLSASSQNEGNDKRARYAIDGKPETIWHTQFSPKLEKHPHELILDLKKVRLISGVQYLARQDNGWNGTFGKTEFFLSKDREIFSDKPFAKTFSKEKKKPQTFRFPKATPPASSKYGFFRRAMARNGHPPPRSACSSGDDFRQIRKMSPLLLFGHPHLPLPNARITDVV